MYCKMSFSTVSKLLLKPAVNIDIRPSQSVIACGEVDSYWQSV